MTFDIVVLQPLVALIAGILILLIPRLLNYVVAIYLLVIGVIGLWPRLLYHVPHCPRGGDADDRSGLSIGDGACRGDPCARNRQPRAARALPETGRAAQPGADRQAPHRKIQVGEATRAGPIGPTTHGPGVRPGRVARLDPGWTSWAHNSPGLLRSWSAWAGAVSHGQVSRAVGAGHVRAWQSPAASC